MPSAGVGAAVRLYLCVQFMQYAAKVYLNINDAVSQIFKAQKPSSCTIRHRLWNDFSKLILKESDWKLFLVQSKKVHHNGP